VEIALGCNLIAITPTAILSDVASLFISISKFKHFVRNEKEAASLMRCSCLLVLPLGLCFIYLLILLLCALPHAYPFYINMGEHECMYLMWMNKLPKSRRVFIFIRKGHNNKPLIVRVAA
jgi:hypothetical protein